jgi:hypothetical protein
LAAIFLDFFPVGFNGIHQPIDGFLKPYNLTESTHDWMIYLLFEQTWGFD